MIRFAMQTASPGGEEYKNPKQLKVRGLETTEKEINHRPSNFTRLCRRYQKGPKRSPGKEKEGGRKRRKEVKVKVEEEGEKQATERYEV